MSRKRRKETTSIPKHRHCPVCGISIKPENQFCSLYCKKKYEEFMKKETNGNAISLSRSSFRNIHSFCQYSKTLIKTLVLLVLLVTSTIWK
ncbi:MAG: DUF2116 family Zn-ribbon domain-containing protein [Aigarchaeota archaeon]|nr:DUF2116 family Zn-ribbon domain-containing protein [Candidatus Pelearchaeum maunauluense]